MVDVFVHRILTMGLRCLLATLSIHSDDLSAFSLLYPFIKIIPFVFCWFSFLVLSTKSRFFCTIWLNSQCLFSVCVFLVVAFFSWNHSNFLLRCNRSNYIFVSRQVKFNMWMKKKLNFTHHTQFSYKHSDGAHDVVRDCEPICWFFSRLSVSSLFESSLPHSTPPPAFFYKRRKTNKCSNSKVRMCFLDDGLFLSRNVCACVYE